MKAVCALCRFFSWFSKAEAASTVMSLMVDLIGVTFLCFVENVVQGKGNKCFNRWGSLANYYTLQNCWRGAAYALVCFVNLLPCHWDDLAALSTKTWSECSQVVTCCFCGISERVPQSTCRYCSAPAICPLAEWPHAPFQCTTWCPKTWHTHACRYEWMVTM